MSEENKAIVSRFLDELWNKQNLAIRDELAAPRYPSALSADAIRAGFPDVRITVEDQIAEGNKVVTRWTMKGTHKGEYEGVAPTEKQVTMTGIFIHQVEDGKLVDRWNQGDQLGLLQQIGGVPV